MRLSLPQDDHDREARAAQLAEQAAAYSYNRDHMGVLFASAVPRGEDYDLRYALAVLEQGSEILRNRASQSTAQWPPLDLHLEELAAFAPGRAIEELTRCLAATTGHLPGRRPTDLAGYADLIATLPRPLGLGREDDDAFFAWQQVAGATPITLRGIDALPGNFPLDAATYARALGGADQLDQALAEGRLFLVDYALFDGLPMGTSDGMEKYLWAPLALFARLADGHLHPVAIQTGQQPGPANPIWTPADGVAWRMAKTAVQTAEMNMNGVVAHFGLCHAVAEAFICITHRQLAPAHPLLHLLGPHFHYTLAVNETARTSLVSAGGTQEVLQSGTLAGNFVVINRALAGLRFDGIGARAEFAARRVDDPARLPNYPFRDDGVPIADALGRWAEAYVRVYYADDAAVAADAEVQGWAAELGGPGGFGGMPALDSIAALAGFVGDMLWRLTGYHAVINYGGWDYAAWAPGMPSAAFGPGPRAGASEADWMAMLPPLDVANRLLELMHTLRTIRINRLGDYPLGHFLDRRVHEALAALGSELEAIGAATAARDAARPWSFPFLHPTFVPNSIHV
jgi:arachidonate 15-lipoxygenase